MTNKKEIISTSFRGSTGTAYLFHSVTNINLSRVEERVMITGHHFVRDVYCKCCETKLGWMYEFARDPNQSYKEGNVILEQKLLEEVVEKGELAKDVERALIRSPSASSMISSQSSIPETISSVTIT